MKAVEEFGDWRVNGQRSQERVDAAGVVRVCACMCLCVFGANEPSEKSVCVRRQSLCNCQRGERLSGDA